ncbi:multiple epidermal growth factor-like domains protein 10 [Harpegnathos saltator]|uniref:multiple epidermal growth factor-like domains protein 10 n=1 Tax=Harpegnathos saltator TaxID=610380 RepID=UPI000DBECF28|nr:multiple epidermal growth factor-like domains protein 10 [Harpegnathos saltator]
MKFWYVICTFGILQIVHTAEAEILESNLVSCQKIVSFRNSRRVPYLETYNQEITSIFHRTQVRWNYRTEYYTSWRSEKVCCPGYTEINGACEPVCKPACGNGTCTSVNVCSCDSGYSQQSSGDYEFACVPVCTFACQHGRCTAPEFCTCDDGYSLSTYVNFICKPICKSPCENGSYCDKPDHCACPSGYAEITTGNDSASMSCEPVCKNKCINSVCKAPNICACNEGYELDLDNLFVCKPKCDKDCIVYGGTCTAPNVCTCQNGYSLQKSDVCEPICSQGCVMGACVAPEKCKCFEGYGLLDDSSYICKPICSKTCYNGRCIAPDTCICNEGYRSLYDKRNMFCEPYCEPACSNRFSYCATPNRCKCLPGYQAVNSTQNKADDSNSLLQSTSDLMCERVCDPPCVNSYCKEGKCVCYEGYRIKFPWYGHGFIDSVRRKELNKDFCEPICNPPCENGQCSKPNVCICNEGYRLSKNNTNTCEPVCKPACVENTFCLHPNICACNTNYHPSYQPSEFLSLRYKELRCKPICNIPCTNGTCVAPNVCQCSPGYENISNTGCKPVCTMCNNGTCVAPEVCECDDGFILEQPDGGTERSLTVPEDEPGNRKKCIPSCEGCDNGECVAPNDCRCNADFLKINDTCVYACENICGTHSECNIGSRGCECNYGWTGMHCDQPDVCVLILNNDDNRIDTLKIIEKYNATIEHVFTNNPACPECINKLNNETLCFKTHIDDTKNAIRIGCLIDGECLQLRSKYEDQKEMIKLSGITISVGILILIATTATYILLRKYRNGQLNYLAERNIQNTSMQGLIEEEDHSTSCLMHINIIHAGTEQEIKEINHWGRTHCNDQSKYYRAHVDTVEKLEIMKLFRSLTIILATGVLLLEVGKWSRSEVCASSYLKEYAPSYLLHDPMLHTTEEGVCTVVVSRLISQYVPYTETYRAKSWFFYRIKTRQNYRLEYHTIHTTERNCCKGYRKVGSLCKPYCATPCEKAVCVAPNTCMCNVGYQTAEGTNGTKCQPVCANGCVKGTCVEPDICECNKGYWMSSDGITCLPICDKECERNYGFCSEPHVCSCHPGYRKASDDLPYKCEPICDFECTNGRCVAPNVCKCTEGYEKDQFDPNFTCSPKCSEGCVSGTCTAPEVCTCNYGYKATVNASVCEPVCSEPCNMGICVAPETCSCNDGYGLVADSNYICEPICQFNCNHGTCTAPGVCTCDQGFVYDNSTETICKPRCEIPCGPNGECTSPNNCTCFKGYRAIPSNASSTSDNSTADFRPICQPVCEFECINGECTAPNVCTCTKGYYPLWVESHQQFLSLDNSTSRICKPDCHPRCGANEVCAAPNVCTCKDGYAKDTNGLCAALCAEDCANGTCTEPNHCTCDSGFESRNGSGCEPICERGCENGDCVAPDHCVCHDDFVENTGYDFVAECIPACTRNCSGHGECVIEDEYNCKCNVGWRGWDCEEPTVCVVTMSLNRSDINRITIINSTDSATMQTLADALSCYQCDSFLSNISLCYMIYSDEADAATPAVSCLLSTELPCYNASSYGIRITWSVVPVVAVIVIGLTTTVYLIYRKHRRDQLIAGNSTVHLMRDTPTTESSPCENPTCI